MKKCKDCTVYGCLRRGDGDMECFYEAELQESKELEEKVYWKSFRAEAAKDILCAMIKHFGTSNIDMNDVVKWTDSLISKLKEKEEK